jgi:hypothetical protein
MAGIWLCADCHSANRDGAARCYKCRTRRANGEMPGVAEAIAVGNAQKATEHLAAAARTGARYRKTWLLAGLYVALSIVNTVIEFVRYGAELRLLQGDGTVVGTRAEMWLIGTVALWNLATSLAGTLVWALWIALVVANVPALTARWTPHTPLGAFMSVWVPILNLKRPYTVVRNVLHILLPGRFAPRLIVLAWWVTLLASNFGWVAFAAYLVGTGGLAMRPTIVLTSEVRLGLLLLTGVFGAAVVVFVELAQRRALVTRAAIVHLADAAAATA